MADTARDRFLARVQDHAPGEAARFAPALDALIAWSEAAGLVPLPSPPSTPAVRYRAPGTPGPLWSATPRASDGAKLALMDGRGFGEAAVAAGKALVARVGGPTVNPLRPLEFAFTRLIWQPHCDAVLAALAELADPGEAEESDVTGSSPAARPAASR